MSQVKVFVTDRRMSFIVSRFRKRRGRIKVFIDYAQGLVQLGQKKKYVCFQWHV